MFRRYSTISIRTDLIVVCLTLLLFVVFAAENATAGTIVVTSTIQAAVDAANPGDKIYVPPGVYFESVNVRTSNLTIQGSHGAVLDAGNRIGIRVGIGARTTVNGIRLCPAIGVTGFTLEGLTIRNARFAAVFLIGVDGYTLAGTKYLDDPVYGPFPVCSHNGIIESNHLTGGNNAPGSPDVGIDAGIYVGDSDGVIVRNNFVTNYAVGIEIENTSNVVVQNNNVKKNSGGIVLLVLPGLHNFATNNVLIERNQVLQNNLPNPVPFEGPTGDPLGNLPTGTGILNVGGDGVVIRNNKVIGNDSWGITIAQNPFAVFDARIEPNPDNNQVYGNVALQNGKIPDPVRAVTPGADIVYDGTGVGTCFGRNVFRTDFPTGITGFFACP